jgi:hypothetical protein
MICPCACAAMQRISMDIDNINNVHPYYRLCYHPLWNEALKCIRRSDYNDSPFHSDPPLSEHTHTTSNSATTTASNLNADDVIVRHNTEIFEKIGEPPPLVGEDDDNHGGGRRTMLLLDDRHFPIPPPSRSSGKRLRVISYCTAPLPPPSSRKYSSYSSLLTFNMVRSPTPREDVVLVLVLILVLILVLLVVLLRSSHQQRDVPPIPAIPRTRGSGEARAATYRQSSTTTMTDGGGGATTMS